MIRALICFGARQAALEFPTMAAFRKTVNGARADGYLEHDFSDHKILIPWHAVSVIEVRKGDEA